MMQTMLAELDSTNLGNSQEDQRALQIALELSNLGLLGTCDDDSSTSSYDEITKGKKSQNMTECVPVPSSEHVAEIVGRQGCKIKALRAKTNTYIKTPVRGEEPVFVVTGRKEDVAMARREVQSAAEHFTQIRASRNRHTLMNTQQGNVSPTNSTEADATASTITLQVRVPYRVVGLVVGPKGATIKRIQQQTHTYIVTPSRDKEPVFEVTGLPENVEKAKEEIEAHIATRTGTQQISVDDDFKNNGTEVGSPLVSSAFRMTSTQSTVSNSNYKETNSTASAFIPYDNSNSSILRSQAPSFFPTTNSQDYINMVQQRQQQFRRFPSIDGVVPINAIPGYFDQNNQNQMNNPQWSTGLNTNDNGPSTENHLTTFQFSNQRQSRSSCSSISGLSPTSFSSSGAPPQRSSPTFSDSGFPMLNASMNGILSPTNNFNHAQVRRVGSDSVDSTSSSNPGLELCNQSTLPTSSMYTTTTTPALNIESGYSSGGTTDSLPSGSPIESLGLLRFPEPTKFPQRCVICNEGTVAAALVPCGHNLFCLACANSVVSKSAPHCPCCNKPASMALFIQK